MISQHDIMSFVKSMGPDFGQNREDRIYAVWDVVFKMNKQQKFYSLPKRCVQQHSTTFARNVEFICVDPIVQIESRTSLLLADVFSTHYPPHWPHFETYFQGGGVIGIGLAFLHTSVSAAGENEQGWLIGSNDSNMKTKWCAEHSIDEGLTRQYSCFGIFIQILPHVSHSTVMDIGRLCKL